MCGISGCVDFQNDAGRYAEAFDGVLAAMRRRGPDESGRFLSKRAALLHSRLSVIDPEHGKQPMSEGRYTLTYNGELYNADDLRRELSAPGRSFTSRSDTEVLLKSYIQWGEGCLDKLNGIYAFAVWDGERLFLARDRMGVKPLFYTLSRGALLFASELKTLLAYPGVKPVIDREGAAELFLLGPGRTPGRTALKGINELKAGQCAVFDESGLKIRDYWRLKAAPHTDSFEDTKERVRWLAGDAIKRQTVSDVPLCSFLSGGLDSSAIAAISGVSRTFSVDYRDNARYFKAGKFQPDSDAAYVKIMSDFLGTEHTYVELDTEELIDALFEAAEARDLPGMADVDSSLLLFCREVKRSATVALSGECADELFGGYPWYRDENVLWQDSFPWAKSPEYRAGFARRGLFGGLDTAAYVRERYEGTVNGAEGLETDSPLERRMRQMFMLNIEWFMQTLLDRKDRCSMHSGLEVRVPFCDHRIAEYLYNTPWEFKNHKGREKGLLREALSGLLPDEVLWRKKSPYPKTWNPAYTRRVSEMLGDLLGSPNEPLFELADRDALRSLLTAEGDTPWYGQLMTVPQTMAYFLQMNHWLKARKIYFSA
ncbi:asparagine synthetase B [Clostridia bacterium]|nr:asparagine synthetase B [Clostridia bacterium]